MSSYADSLLQCLKIKETRSNLSLSNYDSSSSNSENFSVKSRPNARQRWAQRFRIRKWVKIPGFHCCRRHSANMTKMEKTVKATLLIQSWFRRYMARLELRRRYTWSIFQSLEYAGEQDQVKLYNFFNALLTHIPKNDEEPSSNTLCTAAAIDEYMTTLFQDESDDECTSPDNNKFGITFPLTEEIVKSLIEMYKTNRHFRLPVKDVGLILKRAILELRKLPNINLASTSVSHQITVCGDLHGKFDDLLVIFHKNGFPSYENPYIFNGDFVDRGRRGLEVLLTLLCLFLLNPESIFLNRGNHEDPVMNSRYGFIKEVQTKYRRNATQILKLIEGVYRWLPLGCIINNKVLVVHGGLSDSTDLSVIRNTERANYISLLRPPMHDNRKSTDIDKAEWKQMFDILWSDPMTGDGCVPNSLRGAGTYFGPNVTKSFLENNNFLFLIRSHECKVDGYELQHDDKVITIFSASNYYEIGSNNGAYLKLLGDELIRHFVQFSSNIGSSKTLNFFQKMSVIESSVIREIRGQILKNKDKLEDEFKKIDTENEGQIKISDWCKVMEIATGLELPWRMLRDKLVVINPTTNLVNYQSTFDNIGKSNTNSVQGTLSALETLYKNKQNLETIFKIIDKDNSGYITLDEFSEACDLIKEFLPCANFQEQVLDICRLMDLNKDGLVDLNEFLESFRMVDKNHSKTDDINDTVQIRLADINISVVNQTEYANSLNSKSCTIDNQMNELANKRDNPSENVSPSSLNMLNVSPINSSSIDGYLTKAAEQISGNLETVNATDIQKSTQSLNQTINSEVLNIPKAKSTSVIGAPDTKNIQSNASLKDLSINVVIDSPVLSTRRPSQI